MTTGPEISLQSSGDEKVDAIIQAARETFLTHGFATTTMDQIALVANVSKRTVYNRFRSKEELFGAAIEETCRHLLPVDIADIEANLPPRDFIIDLSRRFVTGILTPEALSLRRIACFEAERIPSIGRSYLEHGPLTMAEICAPILARIADRGGLRIRDAHNAIWRLGALITEPLHTQMLLGASPDDLEAAIEHQVTQGVDAFFRIYSKD